MGLGKKNHVHLNQRTSSPCSENAFLKVPRRPREVPYTDGATSDDDYLALAVPRDRKVITPLTSNFYADDGQRVTT